MTLDAKIPPPVIAVSSALLMWVISRVAPVFSMPTGYRWAGAVALVVAGIAVGAAGVLSFRRARTTLNPTQLSQASAMVHTGIYRYTRNPMYLGLLLVLMGWSVFLASAWALLGAACFVLYIGRFQIAPEERALLRLFGDEFAAYMTRVRRWL